MHPLTMTHKRSFDMLDRDTKLEQFLETMDWFVPWATLDALIDPYYPQDEHPSGSTRPSLGSHVMLRIYFLQQWFSLSDAGAGQALHNSAVLRRFAGLHHSPEQVPDENAILHFRHLLRKHLLTDRITDTVNLYLEVKGIKIAAGSIVECAIGHASN